MCLYSNTNIPKIADSDIICYKILIKSEDVLEVKMCISENQSAPDWNAQEYWGWYDFELKEFSLIFPNYKLLFVCFPYGIKSAEDCGKGKAYRLEIV